VSRSKRGPWEGAERREDWLRRGQPARKRPWALEEQLLTPLREAGGNQTLLLLAARLVEERAELSRMEEEVDAQALRVAELVERLNLGKSLARRRLSPGSPVSPGDRSGQRRTIDPHPSQESRLRDYWLCRCEGFSVDSPTGRVGVVEGLRYQSRLDQPDLLEVRAGLFGRKLLEVSIEEVEAVVSAEERVVLRSDPRAGANRAHELLTRLRSKLSTGHPAASH
jgi:hypothetical protein